MGVQVGLLKAGSKRLRLEVTGSAPKVAFDWLPEAGSIKLTMEIEGRRLKV